MDVARNRYRNKVCIRCRGYHCVAIRYLVYLVCTDVRPGRHLDSAGCCCLVRVFDKMPVFRFVGTLLGTFIPQRSSVRRRGLLACDRIGQAANLQAIPWDHRPTRHLYDFPTWLQGLFPTIVLLSSAQTSCRVEKAERRSPTVVFDSAAPEMSKIVKTCTPKTTASDVLHIGVTKAA